MSTMPDGGAYVTGGVDTHRDSHTAAALNHLGAVLGTATFGTDRAGYDQLLSWLKGFGPLEAVGVEGTGSYGAGLARHLQAAGIEVREVIRPNRQHRRRYGKSDPADAVAAAKSVLNGQADAQPRGGVGPIESIRLLKIARNSATKHQTAVTNQIRAVIVTAPDPLRTQLKGQSITRIVNTATRWRPTDVTDPYQAAKLALKTLARRHHNLTTEIKQLDQHLKQLVKAAAPPALLEETGIGTQTAADLLIATGSNPHRLHTEAAFAALCGVSPVDASSGRQQRHRLNRGGDRQANAALHRIIIVRLRYHQPTRQYMARRTTQGKTKKEIIRCLKRHLARTIHKHLTHPT
jgi:transposase